MNAAFEAVNLSKSFGRVRALDGVSLAIPRGEFYGLLGTQWRQQIHADAPARRTAGVQHSAYDGNHLY